MDAHARSAFRARESDAPYRIWGEHLESEALTQMRNACKLPVAVSGALMPDAHVGSGLPIGGVLATKNAVIPYAVGVDIACRMKMSVIDLPLSALSDDQSRLANALERETQFGVGASFRSPRQHDVMDEDWTVTAVTAKMKERAWSQLAPAARVAEKGGVSARREPDPGVGHDQLSELDEVVAAAAGSPAPWGRPAMWSAARVSPHP
jgi:tRNA-splicing ligase RtcB